jgi:hypothetical protein
MFAVSNRLFPEIEVEKSTGVVSPISDVEVSV